MDFYKYLTGYFLFLECLSSILIFTMYLSVYGCLSHGLVGGVANASVALLKLSGYYL